LDKCLDLIDTPMLKKFKYEHKSEKLATVKTYRKRVRGNFLLAALIITSSLMLGIIGYKITIPEFDWYDSLLNASMILSGMGPVVDANIILTPAAKVFASFYALFSGVTFLTSFSILIAPVIHRFFHKLHVEDEP
jgi:hypothetical protein